MGSEYPMQLGMDLPTNQKKTARRCVYQLCVFFQVVFVKSCGEDVGIDMFFFLSGARVGELRFSCVVVGCFIRAESRVGKESIICCGFPVY